MGLFKQAGNFNLGIVVLPEKLDPDEYVKKYGPERYQQEIKGAISPTDFYLLRLKQKYNLNNEREKMAYLNDAMTEIASLASPVEQDIYLQRLGKESGVSTDALKASLSRARRRQRRVKQHTSQMQGEMPPEQLPYAEILPPESQVSQIPPKAEKAQQRLLYAYIGSDEARSYLLKNGFVFPSPEYQQAATAWLDYVETHDKISLSGFLDFVPEQLQSIIVSTDMAQMPGEITLGELDEQVAAINLCKIDEEIGKLQQQIEEARRKGDPQSLLTLTQQILRLRQLKKEEEEGLSGRSK